MKTIAAVPESITLQAYLDLMAAVGFKPEDLRSLEFRTDGIYAEIMERDERGNFRIDREADKVVISRVWIPVVKD